MKKKKISREVYLAFFLMISLISGYMLFIDSYFEETLRALISKDLPTKELADKTLEYIHSIIKLVMLGGMMIAALMYGRLTSLGTKKKKKDYEELNNALAEANVNSALMMDQIQEKIAKQTEKLRKQNNDLKGALEAKGTFLANMSHELRTPLNSIVFLSKELSNIQASSEDTEKLGMLRVSTIELLDIMNDIFDFTELDKNKIEINRAEFNIKELILATLQDHKRSARQKGLFLNHSFKNFEGDIFFGDGERIIQVLNKLINNAIKFTENGGISIDIIKKEYVVQFKVSDTGIGFTKEKEKVIFQALEQGEDPRNKSYKGAGMGLSIAKIIVEALNGKIETESGEVGATFKFEIPMVPVDNPSDVIKELKKHSSKLYKYKAKVLAVEDNHTNQMVIKHLLKRNGIVADVANNGDEAVKAVEYIDYDLILMDCHMPIMNGYDATEIIRKELNKNVPIVALTADIREENKQACKDVGMNGFLTKPIDENKFELILLTYLEDKIVEVVEKIGQSDQSEEEYVNEPELKKEQLEIYLQENGMPFEERKEFVLDIVKSFKDNSVTYWKEMERSVQEKDKDLLKHNVHAFKSSAGTIGLMRVFSYGDMIDKNIKGKDFDILSKEVEQLKQYHDEGVKSLDEFLSKLKS
jgi:signal transduction histidine kinase/CheY-like chemotaxis protein/HPt (histidine-containing phosphotransfer) domain-containing protein